MAQKIDALLSKTRWSGADVGKAILLNLCHDFKNKGAADHKPLFSQSELDRMQRSIETEKDRREYNAYVHLYNGLVDMYNLSQGNMQQAQNGYYRLLMYITNAKQAEDMKRIVQSIPLIMTQKQYDEIAEKRTAEKRAFESTFSDVILTAVNYFVGDYYTQREPSTPPTVNAALEALKKEPLKNELLLQAINTEFAIGYYRFPDGKTSVSMSEQEFQAELLKYKPFTEYPALAEAATKDYFDNPAPPSSSFSELYKVMVADMQNDYKGIEWEELSPIKWETQTEPLPDITKWDIIGGSYSLTDYFNCCDADKEDEREERFKLFISEFPALFKAVKEDMAQIKGLEKFAKTTAAKYCTASITWGDLADCKAYSFPDFVSSDNRHEIMQDLPGKERIRAFNSGIAIIKEDTPNMHAIDDNGYYNNDIKGSIISLLHGLEGIMANDNDIRYITVARERLLLPALKGLIAYDKLLELLAKEYGVSEIKGMQSDVESILGQVEALNELTLMLYKEVTGTGAEKENKRKIIKDLFPIVDLEALHPSESAIAETVELISNRDNVSDLNPLLENLIYGGEESEAND